MTRSAYFDDFADIRNAVCQRLLAVTDADLPKDGSAGPPPFDIEPLEKWLFEAYVRHYKDEPNRHGAFWIGFADALEKLLSGSQHFECVRRCSELLEHISNDPNINKVKKESFVETNRLLARPTTTDAASESDAIERQIALLKIALFTSTSGSLSSVLEVEERLRATLSLCLGTGPTPDAQLVADAICWLLRAWLHTENREVQRHRLLVQWCAVDDHLERFGHCTEAMERVVRRCTPERLDAWSELIAAATNRPLPATAHRAQKPGFYTGAERRSMSSTPQLQAA